MICPSKLCKVEIPEDSFYCDQCGIKILKCSKCGAIGISKFCGKCGEIMSFSGESQAAVIEPAVASQNFTENQFSANVTPQINVSQPPIQINTGTQIIQLEQQEKRLQLCNTNGIVLDVKDGSLLGRTTGDFVSQLGQFPVISSRHAQISKANGKWFVTDLGSTNKTYVNGVRLAPNNPTEIKENDVVIFANITFVARFK